METQKIDKWVAFHRDTGEMERPGDGLSRRGLRSGFVKGRTGFGASNTETAADPSTDTAADPSATESPGDFDSAAPADEFGKQSSLDQAGIAQADINSWSTAPVIVEQANSQDTLNPDDLRPAWGGSQGSGT